MAVGSAGHPRRKRRPKPVGLLRTLNERRSGHDMGLRHSRWTAAARLSTRCSAGGSSRSPWALPLIAPTIYRGLRKGELLGLRKSDVDLRSRLLTVSRSYDRDTTKGGHADVIPIAAELVPYLERALAQSPSTLVFPVPDGSMMSEQIGLEHVLRRPLGRAGIVTGYEHVCQPKGCAHSEPAADSALRRCPIGLPNLRP